MNDELIKNLRQCAEASCAGCKYDLVEIGCRGMLQHEAADATEQLVKDLERSKEWEAFWEKEASEALKNFQTTVSKIPRWIPVEERLPEDLKFVLAVEDGIVFTAHCEHYYGEEEVFVEWHDTMYYPVSPTHWMPLPEPPKEGRA